MNVKKQLLIFVALMVLLVGAGSATDVSDDTPGTTCIAEEAIEETQTATDMNNIATQENEEKDVERDISPENGAIATQGIQKNIDKYNTKEATQVTTWEQLNNAITQATGDTTITLQGNLTNTGTIKFDKSIAITIDGNGKTINGNQKQVFTINSESTLILRNIIITNAKSDEGGAIYNKRGTLIITDSTLRNNIATIYGGAINNYGTLNITHTTLQDNIANILGGAIYNWETLSITDSILHDNTAKYGGAIENYGTLSITDSTIANNTVNNDGGAIDNRGTINIKDSFIENNTSPNDGGAIYNRDGDVIIFNSTLKHNEAGRNGGAIYNYKEYENVKFNVMETFFIQNHAVSAGAIFSDNITNIIKNNNFTGNTADDYETLVIHGEKTIENNIYDSTDICFRTMNLTLKDNQESFGLGDGVELNFILELEHPDYYDGDILEKLNKTLYINGEENVTTVSDSHTYNYLNLGNYNIKYTSCNQQSNTVTFKIILAPTQKDVYNYTQLIDAISYAKTEGYILYTINLRPGNYNATDPIDWGDSATRKIIINGNGITLDGNNTYQFINITNGHNNLTLNNLTITNYTSDSGGAIYNSGTLSITDSTLTNNIAKHAGAIYNVGTLSIIDSSLNNNTATQYGGAIRNNYGTLSITHTTLTDNNALHAGAIWNYGTLSITDSTLINNTATHYAGAIYNSGTLTITDSTLANSTANIGGAIHNNYGRLNIINITLANNTANEKGGAISYIYQEVVTINEDPEYINVIDSNFIKNHAGEGGAIYSLGYANLTGNTFSENTADNKETIDLNGRQNGIFEDNQYISTDISLNIELSIKDNMEIFETGEDVTLNFIIELEHPLYYDSDILEKTEINKTLYVNGVENVTTNNTNYILSNLSPGKYTVNYSTTNNYSNNVTFKVMGNSEIRTDNETYYYYDGIKDRVTLTVTDFSGEKGTADIYVKDGDRYLELVSCHNVNDGYTFSTEILKEALENLYADELEDSYTINVTYTGEYAHPSSTELTLNIIKQRNTTILYDILNNTEGNVQIYIIVLDDIYRTPVPDAAIKITGDIQQETFSGIITDTTLYPGDYTITISYEENADYKASNVTFDFTVEIDKDALINELLAPKKTTITLDPVTDVKYNSNVTIIGSLVNEDSVGLYNQVVTITIGDKEAEVTTRGGIFEYTTTLKTVGEQTIIAKYEGTDKYKASNTTQTFTVSKRESKVTVNDIAGVTCYDNVTITGMITDIDDNPLGHVNVFVYLNGEEQHVTTYRTGIFKATFTTTTVGQQEVLVVYKGNKNYIGSNATVAFTSSGMKLVMFTVKPVTYRDTYTIQGKLTDHEGNVVTGAEVQLTVNGETITLTTDKNGKYTYKSQSLALGNFTVTATCDDEATGTQLMATRMLTVTKHVTKLVVDEIPDTTVGTTVTISGKLTDDNGTVYKNCNIYVKINGVEQHVKTDTKGVFTCTYTPTSAGTQNVTVTYKGNSNYLGDKITKSFTAN